MTDKYNIALLAILGLLVYIIYLLRKPRQEGYASLNDVQIHPSCTAMTADTLLKAFEFDIDRLSAVLVSLEVNPNILRDTSVYPKVASLLISKGLLREEKCKE